MYSGSRSLVLHKHRRPARLESNSNKILGCDLLSSLCLEEFIMSSIGFFCMFKYTKDMSQETLRKSRHNFGILRFTCISPEDALLFKMPGNEDLWSTKTEPCLGGNLNCVKSHETDQEMSGSSRNPHLAQWLPVLHKTLLCFPRNGMCLFVFGFPVPICPTN